MTVKPLFDRILVKPIENTNTTPGGIMLSASTKEKPQFATVIAVGEGGVVDGNTIEMKVSVGDKIVFAQYSGNQIKIDGDDYIILRQSDVLATVID